jgi:hypothetical protein
MVAPKKITHSLSFALAAVGASTPRTSAQSFEGLVFNQPVQANNATHAQLGGYYTGTIFDFLDVAPASESSVDMRVTISEISASRYSLGGSFAGYGGTEGSPGGDLGFLYSYTGGSGAGGNFGVGGLTYQLDFYAGGGTFSTPHALSSFRLMIYDIDGEPSQAESVMAYAADGLASYQLSDSSALAVAAGGDGSYRFNGPLALFGQDDPDTAIILNYANTSSIRLRMMANTNAMSPNNNGVFGAIDGDLSSIDGSAFGAPVSAIPEPSTALFGLFGLFPLLRRRR